MSSSSSSSRYADSGVLVETAVFVDAFLYNHMARTHFPDGAAEQEMTHFVLAMINAVKLTPSPSLSSGNLGRPLKKSFSYYVIIIVFFIYACVRRCRACVVRRDGLISQVQLLYQDESLGRQVDFQVQRLEMWSRQPAELQPALTSSGTKQGIHDIDRYLHRFW